MTRLATPVALCQALKFALEMGPSVEGEFPLDANSNHNLRKIPMIYHYAQVMPVRQLHELLPTDLLIAI